MTGYRGTSEAKRVFTVDSEEELEDHIKTLADRLKFPPNMIYNVDETGVTTVQAPKQVVAEKGKKQVGAITSAERGELVTAVCAANATGIRPVFVFPKVRCKDHFLTGAPAGSIGASTKSGRINEGAFNMQFNAPTAPLIIPVLLIPDNHEAHISLRAVETAKRIGVATLPPHTSHRLQSLDPKCVFGPFETYYNRALDGRMRSNPGQNSQHLSDTQMCK
ncbi:hypothetical protein SKAU_G00240130 [Synaphobranchus kaupii]|uniref:DDE-1 domain-containing protein n=1 Tax=Synaphobranchus kaupii TaxID=118154 RepID=A0A9Q1F7B0_SYNKA|nr:hypothetical protein SKAU_G00240130 [Synaphobranchus kaupii]